MKRKTSKAEKGITLVALIITIIVLLILAGVVIGQVASNRGILNRAKDSTAQYSLAETKEKLNSYLLEYNMDKVQDESLTLQSFLQSKSDIEEVTTDGDNLDVIMNDKILVVNANGTEVISAEELKGVAPVVEFALYSDAAGTSKIDASTKYDSEYIGVKVTNASDYTSLTLTLTDPKGSTITSTTVSGFNGYYQATSQGIYTLKVSGTNSEATRNKTQKIEVANLSVLPGSTILKANAPAITATGLIYADLDGDTSTAEGLVVAASDGSAVTASTTMPDEYTMSDYAGESKTASGKIITTTTSGGSNFYVLALADYDANYHYWYKNAYENMSDYSTFTSTAIGQGKTNTSKMIDRVKNPSNYTVSYGDPITAKDSTYTYGPDMWYLIKDETDWFVPSKDEWKAILNNLTNNFSLNTSNYSNYGLSSWYWSSSQNGSHNAWSVGFNYGNMGDYNVDFSNSVRLCATF